MEASVRTFVPQVMGKLGLFRIRARYFVVCIIFGVAAAWGTLGLSFVQHSKALRAVDADLAIAQRAVSSPVRGKLVELQRELQVAQDEHAAALGRVPEPASSTAFLTGVTGLAEANGAGIVSIQSRAPQKKVVGQHNFEVKSYALTLDGEVPGLVSFIAALEKVSQPLLVVKSVQFAPARDKTSLTVEIEVFGRLPDSPKQPIQTKGATTPVEAKGK